MGLILINSTCNAANTPLTQNLNNNISQTVDKTNKLQSPWQHTSIVGTIDNPTIDGGVISSTDEIPIYHETSTINSNISQDKLPSNIVSTDDKTPSQNHQILNDNWATSERIKLVLENAIKAGKLQFVLKQSSNLNLPASVALVPIVESEYKDNAISNKGAVGSWQLMPNTAMEYGLNPQDRTNFIPETNAALMLLKNLHQHFGNWDLAFAAYNAGTSRVDKALKNNPSANSIDELNLPPETKKYVSTIHQITYLLINSNSILT